MGPPSPLPAFALAPRSIHERLLALGFSFQEYWVRFALGPIMLRNGLTHLPLLRAVLDDPRSWEAALPAAQPFGDVGLVPTIAKAFAGKKNKVLARSWILRHPRHAAAGAIALWSDGGEQAPDGARVLRYLDGRGHRSTLLELASAYDAGAVTQLLDQAAQRPEGEAARSAQARLRERAAAARRDRCVLREGDRGCGR